MEPLLPASLRFLIRLHARGFVRRLLRKAKGVKGIVMTVVGGILLLLWLGSVFLGNLPAMQGRRSVPVFDPATIQAVMPVGLLGLSLMTLLGATNGKGISFTAAESDFLFPGPYSRRQIIMYRLCRNWVPVIWGAFFFGTGMRRFAGSWAATYVAAGLVLIYIQVFATAASLAFARVEQKISASRFRNMVLGGMAALCVAALYLVPAPQMEDAVGAANGFNELVMKIVHSPLMQRAAMPFKPFAYVMTAPTLGVMAMWAAVCVAVIVATVVLTLRLDADFYESAASLAAKQQEALARGRKGQIVADPGKSRLRLPALPRVGGAGAIFWRQGSTALRSLKVVIFVLLIAIMSAAPLMFSKGVRDPGAVAGVMGMMLFMVTFMGGALFRFDFRADVDRMDTLKALPISPIAVTLGQLATPVLFMAAFQVLILGICTVLLPSKAGLILRAGAFVPIFSLLFTAIENLAFLLFPHRGQVTPGDLTATARGALILLAKLLILASVAGISVGMWWVAQFATGSHAIGLLVAWVVAAALAVGLVPVVAFAYGAFDVSGETTADS